MNPPGPLPRVFLDANVLFSAAYGQMSDLRRLWLIPDCILVTSDYAITEACRALPVACIAELDLLLRDVEVVVSPPVGDWALPSDVVLPDKDMPILIAAIHAQATHSLTGDKHHFGALYGRRVNGVLLLRPRDYPPPSHHVSR